MGNHGDLSAEAIFGVLGEVIMPISVLRGKWCCSQGNCKRDAAYASISPAPRGGGEWHKGLCAICAVWYAKRRELPLPELEGT